MRRILVATDFSEIPDVAFDRACDIASGNCGEVHVLRLSPNREVPDVDGIIDAARAAHPCIARMSSSAAQAGPVESTLAAATACQADLIVLRNNICGAVPGDAPYELIEQVLRRTDLPVLAVQNRWEGPYRRILAMVEHGREVACLLDLAGSISTAGTIFLTHAITSPQAEAHDDLAAAIHAETRRRCDLAVHIVPVFGKGDVMSVLIRSWQADRPDLVVAATHAGNWLETLLHGSDVNEMLEDLPFDILARRLPKKRAEASRSKSPAASRHAVRA
jgi:nucleotide-binding universal stress UspA family protein